MSLNHFDVITLGNGLATRLCAALLAKAGKRVLAVCGPATVSPTWPLSSPLMEQILTLIDGRSCLKPALHFQLIDEGCRVDFKTQTTLKQELLRELPQEATAILALLEELHKLGATLEQTLWDCGGLAPEGIRGHLHFRRACWNHSLSWSALNRPIVSALQNLPPSGIRFVETLFSGLSLQSPQSLTAGEAALLWSALSHSHSLCLKSLDRLLSLRFEQFHGATEPADQMQQILTQGKGLSAIHFRGKSGRKCTADHFLLSPDFEHADLEPLGGPLQGDQEALFCLLNPQKISTLLTPRFILGGTPPLRISLLDSGAHRECRVEFSAPATTHSEGSAEIERRAAERFPFATPEFKRLARKQETGPRDNAPPPWKGMALRTTANTWHCPPLAALGITGDFLAALSISTRIQNG